MVTLEIWIVQKFKKHLLNLRGNLIWCIFGLFYEVSNWNRTSPKIIVTSCLAILASWRTPVILLLHRKAASRQTFIWESPVPAGQRNYRPGQPALLVNTMLLIGVLRRSQLTQLGFVRFQRPISRALTARLSSLQGREPRLARFASTSTPTKTGPPIEPEKPTRKYSRSLPANSIGLLHLY